MEIWARSDYGRASEKAENLLRWMLEDGCDGVVLPDDRSYLLGIQAWTRSGRRLATGRIEGILETLSRDRRVKVSWSVLQEIRRLTEKSGLTPKMQRAIDQTSKTHNLDS